VRTGTVAHPLAAADIAAIEMGIIFQGYPIDDDLQPVAKGAAK
jgi:hypothetical protein